MKTRWILGFIFLSSVLYAGGFSQALKNDEVRPGLCVVVGCKTADELIHAQVGQKYSVQGVSANQTIADTIHSQLIKKGLAGKISVAVSNGPHLPYIDNLINALVVLDQDLFTSKECMRVIAPLGSILIKKKGQWTAIAKSYPKELDEWPMFRHDAQRSNQLQDSKVKVPSGLQWISGAPMAEYMTNQAITSGGRIFYSRSREMKNKEFTGTRGLIIARDAFNGLVLWKKELKQGHPWSRSCLVVHDDRLYTAIDEGMVAIDVATGEVVQHYENASGVAVAYADGKLILEKGNRVIDAQSGEILWKARRRTYTSGCIVQDDFLITTDKENVVCLDLETGKEHWSVALKSQVDLDFVWNGLIFASVTQYDDRAFYALDLKSGNEVWKKAGEGFPAIVNGLGWVYDGEGKQKKKNQAWVGLDPRTGEEKSRVPSGVSYIKGPRCYPARSTESYFMPNFGGIFFLNPQTETFSDSLAGRGTCRFGWLPSNGMVYQPVHTCSCYPLVRGDAAFFCGELFDLSDRPSERIKGPAFDRAEGIDSINKSDWPTLRNATTRSGQTATKLKSKTTLAWQTSVANKITSPVVAGPNVYVAAPEQHQVVAIDRVSGKIAWRYTACGAINSPPTIRGNLVLFGSSDGWAYCLDSSDGALRWRFRAAPADRQMVNHGLLESLWPVPSSVLVVGDTVYLAAGRHAELNGGIFMYALDCKTGAIRWQRTIARPDYQEHRAGWSVDACNNRILSSDGKTLHLDRHFYNLQTGEECASAAGPTLWGGLMGILVDNVSLDKSAKIESFKYWTYRDIASDLKQTKVLQIWSRNKANLLAITDHTVVGIRQDLHEIFASSIDAESKLGKSKTPTPWLWDVTMPNDSVMNALLISGETLLVGGADANGPKIWKFKVKDGEKIGTIKLPAPPRFDGLALAGGDLFVATKEGQVLRFSDGK